MAKPRIARIEVGMLEAERPRHAGSNARIGAHGTTVRLPLARLTTDDGAVGFGRANVTRAQAEALLGSFVDEVFSPDRGTAEAWRAWDVPLWDLAGVRAAMPVYALAARATGRPTPNAPFRVRCYDTSLYFDDLHLSNDPAAAALIAQEAREGFARGHRAFKIKVGRGARWMLTDDGTRRDIAVVRAVREAVGPGLPLMLDANNGYTLNTTKRVLSETADCEIFWMEEPFHEDARLYEELHDWLAKESLPTLIADGEGDASAHLLEWARHGLIDVVQYDVFGYGFSAWLATGATLDTWGRRSAPHHYGALYGNYVAPHLAGAIGGFTMAEWDEATTPALDTSAYRIEDGWVALPDAPGFGLRLDDALFRRAVKAGGMTLAIQSAGVQAGGGPHAPQEIL